MTGPPLSVIVVAEDEIAVRMATGEMLQDEGLVVLEVEDAAEALAVLEAQAADIHLLFTDIHMPGPMNGLELARRTRMRWPWIGVILTSGHGSVRLADLPFGCKYLSKPYEHARLLDYCRDISA